MITQMKFDHHLPFLLFLLLASLMAIPGHFEEMDSVIRVRCSERERQALLKIKDELIDPHGRLSSWGNETIKRDCCKCRGVQCNNRTNHVTKLDLHERLQFIDDYIPLKGKISTSILELQHLQYLDLSYIDFDYAPIPHFIGSLAELRYLNLTGANFSGPIPHHLGNLSELIYLDIRDNLDCYTESLDWVSRLRSLEYLDLSFTNLSTSKDWLQAISKLNSLKELHLECGALQEIPPSLLPSFNGSTSLSVLDLPWNWYIGSPLTLLSWFSNFSNSLTSINFNGNSMPGTIPDVLKNVITLSHLDLGSTDLQGGIPKFFGNMSSLVYLDLSGNNLTGDCLEIMMNFSGPVEEKLQYLDLSMTRMSGLLSNMSRFSSLKELKLRKNQLNGSIQDGYLRLPHLTVLDLSSNQLTGPVPDLSFLSSLKQLILENNVFNGSFSQSIGGLSKLEALFIGSNYLGGIITEAHMFNLSQLRILDLSLNSFLAVRFRKDWVPPFQLEYLNLRNCKLGPYIPSWLESQKEIAYIDISNAGIVDIIPSWFGGIAPKLLYMNASNNQMYGIFPNLSFSRIILRGSSLPLFRPGGMRLDLSRNRISGSATFLCHTRGWELIDLSDNIFSGEIPHCFANFGRLRYLNLANNHFSGKISALFSSLSALSLLHLRNNSFSGDLTKMRNCTNLEMIDLGENKLSGNIPAWIGGSFSQLKALILRSNAFYGSIPSNLCHVPYIQILDLSSNNISGDIPKCLHDYRVMSEDNSSWSPSRIMVLGFPIEDQTYSLDTKTFESAYFMWKGKEIKYINYLGLVKLMDLSSNNLAGEIPPEITKLVGLVGLNFSRNNLTGSIPENIGKLKFLNFLDFSRNHLSGGIPISISDLSHLGVLNFSYNNLSGRIPQSNQALTFDESAYIGNSGLCGTPLNKSCPGDEPNQTPKSDMDVQSEYDEIISEGFYMAMGLGFFVGFWGIFGTILMNKAMRHALFELFDIVGDFVYVRMELSKARLIRYLQTTW